MMDIRIKNIVGILVGAAIFGLSVNTFNLANNLAEGGVTGLAILLKLSLGWDPGLVTLLVNLPLLFIGWRMLGPRTLAYTIWGILTVSFFLWCFGSFRHPLNDIMLAALFAGVGVGLGLGLIFRCGGTTGGTDILARLCLKYFGWKMGRTLFLADILVLGLALTHLKVEQVMYTLICVFVGARVIDFVQDAAYPARAVMVVSERSAQILHAITKTMNRGCTVLQGMGGYTRSDKEVIFTVVSRSEIVKLKNLIRSVDPAAFISISDANDVMGEGFTLDKNKAPLHEY